MSSKVVVPTPMFASSRLASALLLVASAALVTACFASEGQLRMKAASDFDCDKTTLAVTDAGHGVYEVSGCGQSERYVYKDEARAWLRESDAGGKVIEAPPLGATSSEP